MVLLIFFSFLAGFVTILSPCILPILPIVLSGSLNGGRKRPLGIVCGFVGSFSIFTLFLSTIVKTTGISADLLRNFSVLIVLLFGVSLLLPQFQVLMEHLFTKLSSFASTNSKKGTGFFSGFILGVSLGLVWTPCVGPIIASVITLAATSNVTTSAVLITFAYSTGTAIPMLAIMYGGRTLLQKIPWLTRNTARIQKCFGILMILVALAIFFNIDRRFQTIVLDSFPEYGKGLTQIEESYLKTQTGQNAEDMVKNGYSKPAPEFIAGGQWFNSSPLTLQSLRGKVVLVDFWTYTCINCIRTFPYLRNWYEKYEDKGFVIVGVHTPEFEFEKSPTNVAKAIQDFKIPYPVMQDNNYSTWSAYENQYWPAHYLIDQNGNVRYTHFGEGEYDKTEHAIQDLLKEAGMPITETVENPTYDIQTQTPETYLGYSRMERLASPESVVGNEFSTYSAPSTLGLNTFSLQGIWKVEDENAVPQKGSFLEFKFNAREVFLVMTPHSASSRVKVNLNGKTVSPHNSGIDVKNGIVTVDSHRLYRIIKLPQAEIHTLRLEFLDGGISAFAFTFG